MKVSGFAMVRNATRLDFPLEASLRSLLPAVDELVVNVGISDDDTLARVQAIDDPRLRIIESTWDPSRGPAMLADETNRAMAACTHPWGIYIQADEVLQDGSAALLRAAIEEIDADPRVEGVVVDYLHFYGGFDQVATNRSWYRRECRAVRLGPASAVHSFRDAQGFRVGSEHRRIRVVRSRAVMHHYGWARPAWALHAKREADLAIYHWRQQQDPARPLLPWIPGIRLFRGEHPAVAADWIAARRGGERLVERRVIHPHHIPQLISSGVERLTGWRPLEYRNYAVVSSPGSG